MKYVYWILAVGAAIALGIYAWSKREVRATIDISEGPTVTRKPAGTVAIAPVQTGYKYPTDGDGLILFE